MDEVPVWSVRHVWPAWMHVDASLHVQTLCSWSRMKTNCSFHTKLTITSDLPPASVASLCGRAPVWTIGSQQENSNSAFGKLSESSSHLRAFANHITSKLTLYKNQQWKPTLSSHQRPDGIQPLQINSSTDLTMWNLWQPCSIWEVCTVKSYSSDPRVWEGKKPPFAACWVPDILWGSTSDW